MNRIKELVFQESNNLEEALKYNQCQSLYSRLKDEQSDESAKLATLKLFNEARWLACQKILQFDAFVSKKPPYIEVSDSFTEADVRALANQLPTRVPTHRPWFDHGPRELFPVAYKSYDEWDEDCPYTPYDITKGYTDDLLVELLYESTKTNEGKSKLLNDIIERAGLCDDREQLPGWHWALSKRELTKPKKVESPIEHILKLPGWHWALSKRELTKPKKVESPIEHILKKLDDVDQKKFKRFYDWMKNSPRYFKYDEKTKRLWIKIADIEMGLIFKILKSTFPSINKQDYNPLFVSKKGIPFAKGKKEAKHYKYLKKKDVESMREKEREQYSIFYEEMKKVCEELKLKYPE